MSKQLSNPFSDKMEPVENKSEFLNRTFNNLSISAIPIEDELVPILEARLKEAQNCAAHSPLATIFLCGSLLEGLLHGIARNRLRDFNQSEKSPKDKNGKVKPLPEWSLAQLIDVAYALDLLKLDVKKFSHVLRDFRNYIHPYQQMRENFSPDQHTAELCLQALKSAITNLAQNSKVQRKKDLSSWKDYPHAADLAVLLLIGAWNEKNEADVSIVTKLTRQEYAVLAPKIQELLQAADSPLSLHNGIWKLSERIGLWEQLGSRIFDQHLETFKECAVSVLTEQNPAFELSKDQRFAASIYGKTPKYSPALKKGLAEGLTFLGSHPKMLNNCSQSKAEAATVLAVREIFANADWVLWGSLGVLLPVLAEAAPDEFLNAVKNALHVSPCPFDELFAQEGSGGVGGNNYLAGLLWALETLAWDTDYLIQVCVLLGELASRDPGGNWGNRPSNSLSTILLPWFPQTLAPFEKHKAAVKALCNELPEIGWKLVLGLLSSQHGISMGGHKPSWRNPIPDDWKPKVTNQEYWEQVSFYAELAVSSAGCNIDRLIDLADNFGNLPRPSFDRLLEVLSSDAITGLPEEKRYPLWDKLREVTSKHRRYKEAQWALPNELLVPIEEAASKLAPSNPLHLYQYLFSDSDFNLYDKSDNWEERRNKLPERRQQAIEEIMRSGGIESVIRLVERATFPVHIGIALAAISDEEIDRFLLPKYLQESSSLSSFSNGYIRTRHENQGWVDGLDKSGWNKKQITQFLLCLPFNKETWERAAGWLGDEEREYWLHVNENQYRADGDWEIAVDKLLEYDRPCAAINYLEEMLLFNQVIDIEQCVKALLAAASSSEAARRLDYHNVAELIEMLQKSSEVNPDDLFKIEWAYLSLLDGNHGVLPKTLENNLANHPESFCQIIQLVYRSKKSDTEDKDEPSEQKKNIAENAWKLLHNWRTPPGMQEDGSFNEDQFSDWLKRVKELCAESGHLEVALTHIGEMLIHSPPDSSGLWINKTVAAALHAQDAAEMRSGFHTGKINSRGVHWVDPTGKPERELAEKYRQQAEEVENAGYYRLADTLKNLAKGYDREGERVVAEHTWKQQNC